MKQILQQINVNSDSGDKVYKITHYDDNSWACSCPRWIFSKPRQDCKHIKAIKAILSECIVKLIGLKVTR